MRGGEQRPCRFGPNCNKLATGSCTYYHPPSQLNFQGQGPRGQGSGFQHHANQPRSFNSGNNFQGGYQDNPRQNQKDPNSSTNYPVKSNYQGSNPYYQGSNPNYQGSNPNYGQKMGFRDNSSDDPITKQICRNYHFGIECKFGQKCRNKHAFILAPEDSMRRLHFLRNLPLHPATKLTSFKSNNKDIFAMRNGLDINFFDFSCQTKQLGDVFKYSLPDANGKYNFYDQKNEFIYYSKENPDTHYEDIGVYNLQLSKHYYLMNSHHGKLTGMAHFDANVLFTTTMEGELKVWVTQGDELKCHQETTERLRSNFNPQNGKLELYFVDINEVAGTKVIAAGTNDGRLLFFFGQDLAFKQVQLPEQYSKVFRIRYASRQNVPIALVLTWNHPKTFSSVLQINLSDFSIRPLVQIRTTEDQPKAMLNLFQLVHGYLFTANLNGLVSIYEYPNTGSKLGGIFHQNQVSDIVASEDELKNTSLKMKTVFILEKKTEQKEGSLGIYLIK